MCVHVRAWLSQRGALEHPACQHEPVLYPSSSVLKLALPAKLLSCRAPEDILAFSTDAVNHVVEAYCPIVKKHMNDSFTEEQKAWQQIRRGRWAWHG